MIFKDRRKRMKYSAALYMRLSKDDGGGESSGIESQRLLLQAYARSHKYPIYSEYIDDGWSGTRYDRPAFCKMREDIEAKKVNMVITKDFSRLGRNYILTGELTEEYFPAHSVRFIAINDGYDSELGGDDMAPFRHVVNEMYARDISRKIRTALHAKVMAGQYIGSFAPYGYRKDANDKNRLIPDEKSAEIVVMIFKMKESGQKSSDIAEKLNKMKIHVPLDYRNTGTVYGESERKWTSSGVCKILRNQVYIGNTVQGKNKKISFRSPDSVGIPSRDWVVVKNTHHAIISSELYEKINHRKKQ